jgi:formylglycine-generating enzyme required for sulfatase activity
MPLLQTHLGTPGRRGLVLLGAFGSGKTTLSQALARSDVVVVPLRMLVRGGPLGERWKTLVGDPRAVSEGRLQVVLDGLDEVARPGDGDYERIFEQVTALAGPRWILTSRTGYFRTDDREPSRGQVDTVSRPDVETIEIAPLSVEAVGRVLGAAPLPEICSSPILLRLCLEAQAQDARSAADVVARWLVWQGARVEELTSLAWRAFRDPAVSRESASFMDLGHPDWRAQPLERLLVQDPDGHWRFGHRSIYDFLVARRLARALTANQGRGPDELTGLGISEATRVFCTSLIPQPDARTSGCWVRVGRGNFISGGDHLADERPLCIRHLDAPVWLARAPVTESLARRWLGETGPRPPGYWFLRHWRDGVPKSGTENHATYNFRPSDCDALAAWAGCRLPTADEWEKGVRGIRGTRFPWGDHPDATRANTSEHGAGGTRPVYALPIQGPTGLYAAIGDVFECTASNWRGRADRGRIVMGGSFAHCSQFAQAGLRPSHTLSGHFKVGLRLACDDPSETNPRDPIG